MLSFHPRGVLDEILNLIESVSDVFPPTLKGLAEEVFSIQHYNKTQFQNAANFENALRFFFIFIPLSEKFCCRNLNTSIKVFNMTGNSNKSSKVRNINTIGRRIKNHHVYHKF